jgi:hypothetical protein
MEAGTKIIGGVSRECGISAFGAHPNIAIIPTMGIIQSLKYLKLVGASLKPKVDDIVFNL